MQDLSPYFCLQENCAAAFKTFTTSDDWLQHLIAQHSERLWFCNLCKDTSNKSLQFREVNSFKHHLYKYHQDVLPSQSHIDIVTKYCSQNLPPTYHECLFCGSVPRGFGDNPGSPEGQLAIRNHMLTAHMQYYALACIPWDVPGDDLASSYLSRGVPSNEQNQAGNAESDKGSSSTLQFDDHEDQEMIRQHPSLLNTFTVSRGAGAASLDELRNHFQAHWAEKDQDRRGYLEKMIMTWLDTVVNQASAQTEPAESTSLRRPNVQMESSANTVPTGHDVDTLENEPAEKSFSPRVLPIHETSRGQGNGAVNALRAELWQTFRMGAVEELQALLKPVDQKLLPGLLDDGDENGRRMIHLAVAADDCEMVKILIGAGANIDQQSPTDGTPIALAVTLQNLEMVKLLLSLNADPSNPRYSHASALQLASAAGFTQMVELMLDHMSTNEAYNIDEIGYIDVSTWSEKTGWECPLPSWVFQERRERSGAEDLFSGLLSLKGPILHVAAFFGHEDLVNRLVKRGANLAQQTECVWSRIISQTGRSTVSETALTLVAGFPMASMVSVLLKLGADPRQASSSSLTAVENAAIVGNLDCLTVIAEHLDLKKDAGLLLLALSFSAGYARLDCLAFLLDKGVSINSISPRGITALTAACEGGDANIVLLLLSRGANVNTADMAGNQPLAVACSKGHAALMETLIEHGAEVDAVSRTGTSALMASTSASSNAECMKLLLQSGANVDTCNFNGENALHLAAASGQMHQVEILLEQGIGIEFRNWSGCTPLLIAAAHGHRDTVSLFIEKGADIDARDDDGDTALILAARQGSLSVVECVFDKVADVEARGSSGRSAVFEACTAGWVDVLRFLISRRMKIDVTDAEGDAAMSELVNKGHIECLQVVLEANAMPHGQGDALNRAIPLAAKRGHVTCLRLLLLAPTSKPDSTDDDDRGNDKMTGLMLAAFREHVECVRLLLEAGADVHLQDVGGRTALHWAALAENIECVRLLLDHGAEVDVRDKANRTALYEAVRWRHSDCVQLLLQRGADVNVRGPQGRTYVAQMVVSYPLRCFNALWQSGASGNDLDDDGRTAIILAVTQGDYSPLPEMLSGKNRKHFDVDIQDKTGMTALMHAISRADVSKVQLLLEAGASASIVDARTGMNALAMSILKGFECGVASALLNFGVSEAAFGNVLQLRSAEAAMEDYLRSERFQRSDESNNARLKIAVALELDAVEIQLDALRIAGEPAAILRPWLISKLRERAERSRKGSRYKGEVHRGACHHGSWWTERCITGKFT